MKRTGDDKIRVLLVDDHPVVREGVRAYLSARGIEVAGEAADAG
ncbi:MAG TPA: DNA-binding response regulator, partial [Elusimicrobia bacterium]|nr:DNA-binding response regulator [Elusimicrobiota bacterium]